MHCRDGETIEEILQAAGDAIEQLNSCSRLASMSNHPDSSRHRALAPEESLDMTESMVEDHAAPALQSSDSEPSSNAPFEVCVHGQKCLWHMLAHQLPMT